MASSLTTLEMVEIEYWNYMYDEDGQHNRETDEWVWGALFKVEPTAHPELAFER